MQGGSQGGRKESPLALEEPKMIAFFGRSSGQERFFPSWWTLVYGTQEQRSSSTPDEQWRAVMASVLTRCRSLLLTFPVGLILELSKRAA